MILQDLRFQSSTLLFIKTSLEPTARKYVSLSFCPIVFNYKCSQSHQRSVSGNSFNIIETISHCIQIQLESENKLNIGRAVFPLSDDVAWKPAKPSLWQNSLLLPSNSVCMCACGQGGGVGFHVNREHNHHLSIWRRAHSLYVKEEVVLTRTMLIFLYASLNSVLTYNTNSSSSRENYGKLLGISDPCPSKWVLNDLGISDWNDLLHKMEPKVFWYWKCPCRFLI